MVEPEHEKEAPEVEVAKLFQLAGYEVSQAVGAEPGTVDWFAVPRSGFVRARTYFRAWKIVPERLEEELQELERARIAKQADRALAVVLEGSLPQEAIVDLTKQGTTAISLRRLGLELSGALESLRKLVVLGERHIDERVLRRSGHSVAGPIPDVAAYIESWVEHPHNRVLEVLGDHFSGKTQMIYQVMVRVGRRFLERPDEVTPLVFFVKTPLFREVVYQGWATPFVPREDLEAPHDLVREVLYSSRAPVLVETDKVLGLDPVPDIIVFDALDAGVVESWFRDKLADAGSYGRLIAARREVAGFRELCDAPPNLDLLLAAVKEAGRDPVRASLSEWVAAVICVYVQRLAAPKAGQSGVEPLFAAFENAALEQFSLGNPRSLALALSELPEPKTWATIAGPVSTWTATAQQGEGPPGDIFSAYYDSQKLKNPLIFHYFLARKIAREVRAGNLDTITRYKLPREYVRIFLAIFAPDVAAQATEELGEAIRAQIETEVERCLQLTLAHMLKRAAGAVGSHVKRIQRHVERTSPEALSYEFRRIEEEVSYLRDLAERTRRLYEVPENEVEGLSLRASVESIVEDLGRAYSGVSCEWNVDPLLRVRATREVLTEILHCLIENAFQAVTAADGLAQPRVTVAARSEGDTVRLDVLDNGPGVAPGDRDRIFKPYETTKKGGDRRPLGTGMGLPIARRYAEHVGGQVGLDPDREETCFFVRFVAWRDIG